MLLVFTSRITGTASPCGVSTAIPTCTYCLNTSCAPSGCSEALKRGCSRNARATATSRNASGVSLLLRCCISGLRPERKASRSVTSAKSNCVTCGTLSQLRSMLPTVAFWKLLRATVSTGPNAAKSTSGIDGSAVAALAGAEASRVLTQDCTSSLRIRPLGPVPATPASVTPSSRASWRTAGPA